MWSLKKANGILESCRLHFGNRTLSECKMYGYAIYSDVEKESVSWEFYGE